MDLGVVSFGDLGAWKRDGRGEEGRVREERGTDFAFELYFLFVVVGGVPFREAGFPSGCLSVEVDWDHSLLHIS